MCATVQTDTSDCSKLHSVIVEKSLTRGSHPASALRLHQYLWRMFGSIHARRVHVSPNEPLPDVNRLIATLPRRDRQHFLARCDLVDLQFAEILCEPGERIHHVYFPTTSLISLTKTVDGCERMEVALIGNEGMLGSSLILGVDVAPLQALAQGKGAALRMEAESFRHELEHSAALQRILLRYVHVVLDQLAQLTACTRFHLLEPRLARWLLMTSDRARSDHFHVTHEFLAFILGMRRVGITKAANLLQQRKLIAYSRGNITIIDRAGLQALSCSCYEADKAIYAGTLGKHTTESSQTPSCVGDQFSNVAAGRPSAFPLGVPPVVLPAQAGILK
jgi:CRP-like cAMP-binding protein